MMHAHKLSAAVFHGDGGHGGQGAGCCKGKPADSCCKTSDTKCDDHGGGCCGGGGARQGVMEAMLKHVHAPATREEMMQFPTLHLTMRYRKGIENIDRRIFELNERQLDMAFVPEAKVGRWPARVLLGHVSDAELVFVTRMRRAVGEDNPVVSLWDEDAFVDSGIYGEGEKEYALDAEGDHARVMRAVGGCMATIHTLRQWTAEWLMRLPESAWERAIMHPERGRMTLKEVLSYATWHLEHHCGFLAKKLDRMGIPMPADEDDEHGGCGSGCGCGS